jgi:hypothetical protein
MKELPILFSAPMVKAILEGRKTMTRRLVKVLPENCEEKPDPSRAWIDDTYMEPQYGNVPCLKMPYGPEGGDNSTAVRHFPRYEPGDHLWVREAFNLYDGEGVRWEGARLGTLNAMPDGFHAVYDADRPGGTDGLYKWRPSIFMPRWASRITLEVTSVKVERLQDISEEDCYAEGIERPHPSGAFPHTNSAVANVEFRVLWESINGPGAWDANPWVWAISFRAIKPLPPVAIANGNRPN